jgi:hypothetical protein
VIPRLIRFSGVLKDRTGNSPAGVVGLTCSLYELPEGGSPLWVGTETAKADEQGRYTVLAAYLPQKFRQKLFQPIRTGLHLSGVHASEAYMRTLEKSNIT